MFLSCVTEQLHITIIFVCEHVLSFSIIGLSTNLSLIYQDVLYYIDKVTVFV